ncbi:glycosyltransferase family 4 protein [Zavarzinia compransoris]|nr:glycosyltransferase family 4 protein [Zavarzinia compransoris]TDP44359.1 glycosyltransferase involved in cell wall biosynthesis [Zavarzinia compransoris]
MAETPRVAIVLPRFARYQEQGATSIDLYARDSVRFSTLPGIAVIGPPCGTPFPDGGTYVPVPAGPDWRRQVLRALRTIKPDVVEVHQDINLAAWAARRLKAPVVAIRHNTQKLPKLWVRRFFKNLQWNAIAAFGFVSEFLRTEFCAALPDFQGRSHVLYNGIDPEAWAPPAAAAREKLIVYVGRLVPEKGVPELIEACDRVLGRHPDWRLLILGGNMADADRNTVAAAGAFADRRPGQVTIEGPVPHDRLPERLARAAIAAVPSIVLEAFGRTAVEAMAAGCALVVSRRGGLAEVVADGTAVIAEPPTAATLEQALEHLIAAPDLRADMGARARAAVTGRFSLAASIGHHDQLRRRLGAAD